MTRTLVIVTVLGALVGLGLWANPATAFWVAAGASLAFASGLLWQSLHALGGDEAVSLEAALSLGAPTALEEQKTVILRALRDLEQDHALGRTVGPEYEQTREAYRQQAAAAIDAAERGLDPYRTQAEQDVKAAVSRAQNETTDREGGKS